jgi:hypothetical protein
LGNAGPDFVSLKLFPMSVERNTFMPKNGLQLEAYSAVSARVDQRRVHRDAGTEGSAQRESCASASRPQATNTPFLGADGENDSIRHLQPPRPPAGS